MTKRERLIAMVAGAAAGILLLDRVLISPMLDSHALLAARHEILLKEMSDARRLIGESRTARRQFRQWYTEGLAGDASATESQLLDALRNWSQESRLTLSSIRPDRAGQTHGLNEITLQATGEGSMQTVARFLHRLEAADMPVRIRELQLASRTDATDDLTMQLRVSTLWDPQRPASGPAQAEAAATENHGI